MSATYFETTRGPQFVLVLNVVMKESIFFPFSSSFFKEIFYYIFKKKSLQFWASLPRAWEHSQRISRHYRKLLTVNTNASVSSHKQIKFTSVHIYFSLLDRVPLHFPIA